jgi:hypothetical protein
MTFQIWFLAISAGSPIQNSEEPKNLTTNGTNFDLPQWKGLGNCYGQMEPRLKNKMLRIVMG